MKELGGSRARTLRLVHSRPLIVQNALPRSIVMFRHGGMVEPVRPVPSRRVLSGKSPRKPRDLEASCVRASVAAPSAQLQEASKAETQSGSRDANALGVAIASAIMALREVSMKSKGLSNKHRGKFDARWLLKWFWWYSFMRMMHRKPLDTSSNGLAKMSAVSLAADNAKTPFQS